MAKIFDRPIIIQKINELTETWENKYTLHARINKTKGDNEYLDAGAIRSKRTLTFEVRYFKEIEDISFNTQRYRISYQCVPYNIEYYDDYMLSHKTVKLLGVSY